MMKHGCSGAGRMATRNLLELPWPLENFPGLVLGNHEVTSDESRLYNCIAWAAGIDHKYVWPDGAEELEPEPEVEWPKGIRNDESVEAFVEYFRLFGYELCDGPELEPGFLKIVMFVKGDCPTHACRQVPSGKWTSKLGFDGVDIEHDDLEAISVEMYGPAEVFMRTFAGDQPR